MSTIMAWMAILLAGAFMIVWKFLSVFIPEVAKGAASAFLNRRK